MGRWQTSNELSADVPRAEVWRRAYALADAWPRWNPELRSAELDGPLALGATAKIVFRTGMRLRFRVTEFDDGRLFTDEARLPGARLGHRHLLEDGQNGGCRLVNTIYVDGVLSRVWGPILGGRAARSLPGMQRSAVDLARGSI